MNIWYAKDVLRDVTRMIVAGHATAGDRRLMRGGRWRALVRAGALTRMEAYAADGYYGLSLMEENLR